ncbi:hypothetical protein [Dactylosporangium matsuzakiense]|uniref:Uncharacterized protein n=1 Tax=Dactylosporangium matsuzakiense TaxID=53360 RepID=A0A9W6KQV5_9ACTN|nr:hypothetical protein [Dactylosporangium matsuzakiense]UWZ42812.1 hypothetical protein Dmats_35575 [Dactylosporangium matsuzakiense]GLL04760.1 hypothetical protein GCM10017581_065070 [Dactylosporangium matsuzakiense]
MTVTATGSQALPRKRAAGGSTTQSRRRRPAKDATSTAAAERPADGKELPAAGTTGPPKGESDLVTWQDLPVPHVKVPVLHMAVPQPKQLLYYGGVGVLATLGVLEWPVAVAAAAGVWVATHSRGRAEPPNSAGG